MIVKAVLLYKSVCSNEKKKKSMTSMTSILDLFSFFFLRFPGTSMVGLWQEGKRKGLFSV